MSARPQSSPTSATEAGDPAPTDDETLVEEDSLPEGHCGTAPGSMTGLAVYQGTKETDCDQARTAPGALDRGVVCTNGAISSQDYSLSRRSEVS
ncbi:MULTISPECIES: hypothetical protein [unclassified Brevibacterium]|uniref:hypothetical protein n=1 Tax=unclassified Brevibacterium TaxID=2614124 RepID=UPI0010F8DE38|nr:MULTISPECIES: hypothetical protein [unclassified Brevibacterium]MCM1013939.1 hypothetical protein [Brevibacterium sp. XM4083]